MGDSSSTEEFNGKSGKAPPVLSPHAYYLLLEKLLSEGKGFGKTEPVAAYFLSPMRFTEETVEGKPGTEHEIGVQPLYIVMDLKEWPNEYGRSLAMKEIGAQYMARMVGEHDMNHHDFAAPGIWTSKPNAFDFDYKRRFDATPGTSMHMYDPNPDAYRVCIKADAPVTIPTAWGKPWQLAPGGALAVREKDVPALSAALQAVREGKMSAEDALFEPDTGRQKSKFDVYGMMPGFIDDNYKPVELKPETRALMQPFVPSEKKTMVKLRLKANSP
jgi:hypothetical protein